jgi:hypothetical protein
MTTDGGELALTARNASIEDLVALLRGQQARKVDVCDQGIADKLGIPAAYLKKMRTSRPALFDANVNGWLVFDGIRASGQPVVIDSCDLTERRMYVRVRCEAVGVLAPALLSGYRSPFTGARGADNPVVFAGFAVANSETGCGACTITPRLVAQVCSNGMTVTRDAVRAVHLGERMDEGVRWSGDTVNRQLALVTAKARDAVAAFLSPGYAERVVRELEKKAGHPVADAAGTVEVVSGRLRYSEAQQAEILDHFIKGGDLTAGDHARGHLRRPGTGRRRRRLGHGEHGTRSAPARGCPVDAGPYGAGPPGPPGGPAPSFALERRECSDRARGNPG